MDAVEITEKVRNEGIAARVARGAAWLDENMPGWEQKVDLAKLDLYNCLQCILGQVSNVRFGYLRIVLSMGEDWAILHGFNDHCGNMSLLNEAWTTLIKERFDTGNLSGLSPSKTNGEPV